MKVQPQQLREWASHFDALLKRGVAGEGERVRKVFHHVYPTTLPSKDAEKARLSITDRPIPPLKHIKPTKKAHSQLY